MLRQRKRVDIVKSLDAFPQIREKYTKTTKIGGTLSIISRTVILYLIWKEINYYLESKLIFRFTPDADLDTKLQINIDLTVATPCARIGADILDTTHQNVFSFGSLEEEDTWWELDGNQLTHFQYMKHLNSYLREEYHSVAHILYKSDSRNYATMPERMVKPDRPFDACRIHGTLTTNKVSGNFHITAGKSIHFPRGHIHLSSIFDDTPLNMSHRINRLSFGPMMPGIVHPLEGDEKIIEDSTTMAQYFLEVVPTDIYNFLSVTKTFQYSVKENSRPINHDKGSHGIPGLYFKYDVSALKVIVRYDRDNLAQFIVRLCSIIAGIVVISGFINYILQLIWGFFHPDVESASNGKAHSVETL
ncbi:endoplasmic reticulum-Golgi intermediate compartment protein 2 [Phlebotomus papatasi]|uniref:endoplasmic reticulum-Golgi intermediate compartment protein 2 n=1 Tax=Phlebotomus papatasi TaxID=29031 RepID=UPI002483CDC7|nr:endoplasmic reticulum-Golgi intermediate compartment protein 2 [Phlebotomus papatasi]